MSIKDAQGNEIKVGALVHVQVGGAWLNARVVGIKEGGIVLGNVKHQPGQPVPISADMIDVNLQVFLDDTAPGAPHRTLIREVEPDKEYLVPKGN